MNVPCCASLQSTVVQHMNTQTLRKRERDKGTQNKHNTTQDLRQLFPRKGCTQVGLEPMTVYTERVTNQQQPVGLLPLAQNAIYSTTTGVGPMVLTVYA